MSSCGKGETPQGRSWGLRGGWMEKERAEVRVQMGDSCVQDRSTVQTRTTQGKQKREVGEMASRAGTPSPSLESAVLPEGSGFHRAWTCV